MQVTLESCVNEGGSCVFATFKITTESHTLGHLLENRLTSYTAPEILYVAYTLRHPLDDHILLKIRTYDYASALNAVMCACDSIIQDLLALKNEIAVGHY